MEKIQIFKEQKIKEVKETSEDIPKEENLYPTIIIFEQNQIVEILDKFEASIKNLEQQQKKRKQQFEYYRNKLLTFD